MAYIIMCNIDYETEGGIVESMPAEYDGYRYETLEEAERGLDELYQDPSYAGEYFYITEV